MKEKPGQKKSREQRHRPCVIKKSHEDGRDDCLIASAARLGGGMGRRALRQPCEGMEEEVDVDSTCRRTREGIALRGRSVVRHDD